MGDLTFRYRTAWMILLTLFCLLWAIPWLVMSYTNRQPVTVHGGSGVSFLPAWTTYMTGLVGFPVLGFGIRLLGSVLLERIVLTLDGQVIWYDWRGREALRTTLRRVTAIEDPGPNATSEEVHTLTVRTMDGDFKFSTMLGGWKELVAALHP